ncbi:MAG TPA: efflux RND transporter periplasmic adaptor subunit [Candidatus Brocadiia bacterium]|nr:efflux RND transporter periplasmic adaptor subunit [Candidatus Brocadiia bacterium]
MHSDQAAQRLTDLVGQCKTQADVRAFLRQFITTLQEMCDAWAVTLWTLSGENLVLADEIERQKGITAKLWVPNTDQSWAMKECFQKNAPVVFRPGELDFDKTQVLVFIRITGLEGPVGLVRLVLPVHPEPTLSYLVNLAQTVCGYCGIFEAGRAYFKHRQDREDINRLMKVLSDVHAHALSGRMGVFTVNAAAEAIGCDRVTLMIEKKPGKLQIEAASNVDQADKKSAWSRLLGELGLPVMALGKPVIFFEGDTDIASFEESIQEKLSGYAQLSGASSILIFPLKREDRNLGILVFESWKKRAFGPHEQGLAAVFAVHAAVTVDNFNFLGQLPFTDFYRQMHDRRRTKERRKFKAKTSKWLAVALFAAVAIFVAVFYPVDDEVKCECFLEPSRNAAVVSEIDGRIAEIGFKLGQRVLNGEILLKLDTRRLELAKEKLKSEIDSIQVDIRRLQGEAALLPAGSQDQGTRVAKAIENEAMLVSKRKELDIVETDLADSILRAPITGTVIEPDRPETLVGMVVKSGEPICRISTLDPLIVKVAIPQKEILRVTRGAQVRMALPTLFGEQELDGELESIQLRSSNYMNTSVFIANVTVPNPGEMLRKGMTGKARVKVGKSNYAQIAAVKIWRKVRYWMY